MTTSTSITTTILVGILIIGAGEITGGGFTLLDTGLITNKQYQDIKIELIDKYDINQLSFIELLCGDSEQMKQYRAVINKEGQKGNLNNINPNIRI